MRPVYTILTFCVILLSCKKDTTYQRPGSEYFPNSVGNYWRYKHVDSVSGKSVFVDVNIIGNTILPGGQVAKIWAYTFPDYIDTNFVYQVGDTVRFVDQGLTVRNTYLVPLQINNKWRTSPDYIFDSIYVTDNRTYLLNNQPFENSFLLNENGHLPNHRWNRLEWLCPNIGMITKNEKSTFFIANESSNIYWELIDYNLK